ncbi:MAG: rnjA [Candidatus Taylorbacteria bacterium]|nr:rnjA [Candidatus Taylorbacteria bacterium]
MDRQNNSNDRRPILRAPEARPVHRAPQSAPAGGAPRPHHAPHIGGGRDNRRPQRHSMPFSPERARERDNSSPQRAERPLNIPPIGENVRIIPLGGVEEVGMNMTVIEYKNDIIVIDMGFKFKDQDTPGIDYILPNTKYLEENKSRIRAVIITHGHLDHVGGIPYIMDRIGNPPLYTRNLTGLMIKKRQSEFPHLPMIDFKIVDTDETVTLGEMKIKFFGVTHSIPDCLGVCIRTPWGNIINPGDYKLEHMDGVPSDGEEKVYGDLAKEKTLLLLTDSTNIENPGFSTPEVLVHENLANIIKETKGRLIISMFSSHVTRIAKIIEACEKNNKKVVIEGRSMKNNVDICKEAKIIELKKDTIIQSSEIQNYAPDRIVILATGAQGDEFAALSRLANKSHKVITLTKNDTVVLSSSIIPGNEKSVQAMKDNIARTGAKIVHYRTSEVFIHSTGHGNRGEIEWLHKKLKPKFFIPIHGSHYMLRLHAELAYGLGMKEDEVVIADNGSIVDITDNGEKIVKLKEKVPSSAVMVDGFAIGDMQEVVLRDRQMLSQDGMFVIIASVNTVNGKLRKSPDIISRGFVYLRENQELLRQARIIIKKTIEDNAVGMNPINFDFIKDVVTDNIARFLFQKTAKRPIVIPVILGV